VSITTRDMEIGV